MINKKLDDWLFDIVMEIHGKRIEKGLSQEKLAKKIGTKQPAIARFENGNHIPSLVFLEKICNVLGIELIYPRLNLSTTATKTIEVNF